MKQSVLVSILAAVLAIGCAKSSNVGPMQEETIGMAKQFEAQIGELKRRTDRLLERGTRIRSDAAGAPGPNALLGGIKRQLDALARTAVQAPAEVANLVRTPDTAQATLQAYADKTRIELATGVRAVRADLEAYESWLANAELAPAPAPPPAAVAADEPPPAAPPANE